MKTFAFLLLITISEFAFSQEEGTRGIIKVKKAIADTTCTANILGYSGKNFTNKKALLKAKKIELSKNCNCEIISFRINYIYDNSSIHQVFIGDVFNGVEIFDDLKKHTDDPKLTNMIIEKIIAKNKVTGAEIELPKIIFDIVDDAD